MNPSLYSLYQKTNPEPFNEELIYARHKEKDDLHGYFVDLFKTLTLPGIEYISSRTVVDETEYEKYIKKNTKSIEESRLDLIEANFRLTHEDEVKDVTLRLFFPKLVDDFFFYLNGTRYYAIYQIADKNWYNIRNGIFLKTLLMPLGVRHINLKVSSESGTEYSGKAFLLDFFTTKNVNFRSLKNAFIYFFIKFGGVQEAINYFNLQDDIEFVSSENDLANGFESFKLKKDFIVGVRKKLLKDKSTLNIVITLLHALSEVKRINSIDNIDFWKKKILNSPTAKLVKADKAIMSLERVLDERTKKNLRDLELHEKESSWSVVRYMMGHYDRIYNLDTVDLYNRRIRLYEYLVYPLLTKFSDLSYRILNSKNIDMKRLETVFSNIGAMFIIKRIIKNELLRYTNATNSMELFSVALKFSARGPQSLGSASNSVMIKYRGLHESYVGNLALNTASASDPGLSGTINPFCKNIDNLFFEKKTKDEDYLSQEVN